MPKNYRNGDERAILNEILRPSDKHIKSGFKKSMLKRKGRLLLDITQKVIMCITWSWDAITFEKMRVMAAIIDNAQVNWLGFLEKRLVEESAKFIVKEKKYVLSSKVYSPQGLSDLVGQIGRTRLGRL